MIRAIEMKRSGPFFFVLFHTIRKFVNESSAHMNGAHSATTLKKPDDAVCVFVCYFQSTKKGLSKL